MKLNYISIGEKIRAARIKTHITQEVLAEKVNLSITHISAIENASTGASLLSLVNIANELDLSMDFLLFDSMDLNLVVESELKNIFLDCTEKETQVLLELLKANKEAIRKLR